MTIAALPDLLEQARRERYAVGYFEAWDIYSLEAVLAAAEAEQSPVIIGIGGLTADHSWLVRHGISVYGHAAALMARQSSVPTAVMFNEAEARDEAMLALEAGYNAVQMVRGELTFDQIVDETRALVHAAHAAGVSVEGEFDELAAMQDGQLQEGDGLTTVEQALTFADATNVDCLAVAVGSVHFVSGDFIPQLDFDLIRSLGAAVGVPLVLHGGSGVPADQLRAAVDAGISKVNFATRLKARFGDGLRASLGDAGGDPNLHFGSRLNGDVLTAAATHITQEVRNYMKILGSSQKAATR